MTTHYKIPEIKAAALLACAQEDEHGNVSFSFNTADHSRETFFQWTMQDDCPMFYLASELIR